MTVIPRRIIALALIACSFEAGVARADDDVLEPTRVSAHGWFFHAGMASAANRGFMSNAGFVVTDEGVVVFDGRNTGARPRDDRRDPQGDAAADPAGVVSHYHADHVYGLQPLLALTPAVVVPGHGPVSRDVARDLTLTRDYLIYLRETMGRAVNDLAPFDDAYSNTDWSRYAQLPAFEPANRINAWGTYLRMEQEALNGAK